MSDPHAAGLDRAREQIAQLHAGVAAGLAQAARDRDEAERLLRSAADLERLVAANQSAADILAASLTLAGFLPGTVAIELPRTATLFEKMAVLARGHGLFFTPMEVA